MKGFYGQHEEEMVDTFDRNHAYSLIITEYNRWTTHESFVWKHADVFGGNMKKSYFQLFIDNMKNT